MSGKRGEVWINFKNKNNQRAITPTKTTET
jgi:hypothetical protein